MVEEISDPELMQVQRASFEAGDAWAVTNAKIALHPLSVLTSEQALARMQAFQITNDAEQEFAAQLLREIKENHKSLDQQRKKILDPMKEATKQTNELFKPAMETLEQEERILKEKIAAYMLSKEAANAVVYQMAAAAATPEQAQQAIAAYAPVAPPTGVSVRYVWRFEVTDPDLVPREYCSPDAKKIGVVDPTATQVPGVRFFQEPVVSSRR